MSEEKTNADVAALPFEAAMKELEGIVARLERGDVPLEESIAIYTRGEALKARCDALLKQAEARIERITLGVFVVGSLLAALAGLLLTGRIASVVSSQGQNMIFYVFAASVIGGISLNGGQGRLIGALTGVLLLGLLQNVLTLSQVAAFWIDACYGAIILLALIITRLSGETPRA